MQTIFLEKMEICSGHWHWPLVTGTGHRIYGSVAVTILDFVTLELKGQIGRPDLLRPEALSSDLFASIGGGARILFWSKASAAFFLVTPGSLVLIARHDGALGEAFTSAETTSFWGATARLYGWEVAGAVKFLIAVATGVVADRNGLVRGQAHTLLLLAGHACASPWLVAGAHGFLVAHPGVDEVFRHRVVWEQAHPLQLGTLLVHTLLVALALE